MKCFILALMAIVPALYGLQYVVRSLGLRSPRLVGELGVILNDHLPTRFLVELIPKGVESQFARGILLQGTAVHRQPDFPWRDAPFEAQINLDIATEALESKDRPIRVSTEEGNFVAWYRERYLRADGGPSPRVPCQGTLEIQRLRLMGPRPVGQWEQVQAFQGDIDLHCRWLGPDFLWGTADDVAWKLNGPLTLRWRSGS